MVSKDSSYDIFINVSPEGSIDLLGNPRATELGVTLFQFNYGLDEFGGGTLWTGLAFAARRIQISVLPLLE
jgi:hypothetical protein